MPPLLVEYADYIADETEKYDESADEDFNPDSPRAEEASSSSDEDVAAPTQRKGKRKAPLDEELDSGDDVTIKAARRKRAKKQKKAGKGGNDDDVILTDDDGEGGLIKTRAQRRVEKVEKKPLARTEGSTIDVDALWAQMTAAPLAPIPSPAPTEPTPISTGEAPSSVPAPAPAGEEERVTISKTYAFAGQDTTEEKIIPRSHLDKYTSDGWQPKSPTKPSEDATSAPQNKANTSKIRRPLRRPSRFDPNPTGYVRTLAPEHQLTYQRATALHHTSDALMPPPEFPVKGKEKTQKLNVVDKSRMDWTGFVDKEGIAEELDTHGKTKEAYLGRMEFLAGVEARREEERKKMVAAKAGIGAT
ncbi:BCNT-domain-containing protein [Setomelanomma holmii]|uniref:SWR1-complex protein 5 n=1 Tax=Setomelanomma holmii TaxID=210430 RepID=A0A9P4H340_9PLEO|nr:BCNT-domain-containing protein [Setomelanomma holmii]